MIDVRDTFHRNSDANFLEFDKIVNPPHSRPDICAFLILDRLVPGKTDMVSAAEHDEIYLEVDPEELGKAATEDDIVDLIRCGVRYDEEFDSLCMFV